MEPAPLFILEENLEVVEAFIYVGLTTNVTMGGAFYTGCNKTDFLSVLDIIKSGGKITSDDMYKLSVLEREACEILNSKNKGKSSGSKANNKR